ncbi:AMP-binding protein [Spirochaeta africana]|uniref:AMP-forming long-chain acyl-CoA synthetase n=1 Tax=Spirochaeta africana (strain ATCC 700263 / DSM 8902 / Z-7692) TaxID=889378 RepID=H9UJS4_SPIAZ|nr:AMP-binding protein [Spirochaeta africana]AFG37767.1 AMP-forming long-chain acyl-CoA synthetase [Spirochaeta africana DSM 8902]
MSHKKTGTPWGFLEEYRPGFFTGTWPTVPEMIRITANRYGERRCFTSFVPTPRSWTYNETLTRIESLAGKLQHDGLTPGMQVGLTGKNSPEWGIAYLAILFAGGVVVPIDHMLSNKDTLRLLERAECSMLLTDSDKFEFFQQQKLIKHLYGLDAGLPDFILELPAEAFEPVQRDETDLAAILFTSGTTGDSKGVMLSHQNLVADCYLAQQHLAIFHTDIFYALLPLHHSYSMLAVFLESLSVGAETVFTPQLAVSQVLKDLKQGNVTMFLGVPMLFNKLLKGLMRGVREKGVVVYGIIRGLMGLSGVIKTLTGVNIGKGLFRGLRGKLSMDKIRICISGGGPLPTSTYKQFNQLGLSFVQGYGLTETSPIITLNPTYSTRIAAVGLPVAQADIKVIDADEHGIGEIVVKGPMVMQGYYRNQEATDEVFTEDGYFTTGDMGYIDAKGYVYLTGRKKLLIVTEGGKNVYPEEIEDQFQLYDEIEQIMVRGYELDKAMKTEGIEALIYPNQDIDVSEQRIAEIIKEVNHNLLPYQRIQRHSVLSEPLPMTTTKKIKRHEAGQ